MGQEKNSISVRVAGAVGRLLFVDSFDFEFLHVQVCNKSIRAPIACFENRRERALSLYQILGVSTPKPLRGIRRGLVNASKRQAPPDEVIDRPRFPQGKWRSREGEISNPPGQSVERAG